MERPSITAWSNIDGICSETEHEHYEDDAGTAQPELTQDLANVGTMFSDEVPHIDPVLNIK